MKKWILFIVAIVAIQAYAADYAYKYLVFTHSDGTKTSLSVDDLKINVSDNGLEAVNEAGTTTLTLATLKTMEFSNDNVTTAIKALNDSELATNEGPLEVYNLSGIYKGSYSSMSEMKRSLGTGIYVIKQNGKNIKMTIK